SVSPRAKARCSAADLPDGQVTSYYRNLSQAPSAKIILFSRSANQAYGPPRPAAIRGALRDRHGRGRRDAMDALARNDEALPMRTAKACGPVPPTLGSSFADDEPRSDGG